MEDLVFCKGSCLVREKRMKNVLMAGALLVVAAPMLLAFDSGVPEPGSFVLLGTGVVGIGFVVWRRNRAKK